MSGPLLSTPLHAWHAAQGARLVDFAGWAMPVQYGSVIEEHLATRNAATLFDVSHMGRLRIDGPDSAAFLDSLLTRKVGGMEPGKVRYSLVCNEQGGILDDILVYLLEAHGGGLYHQLVVNAGNRAKIVAWLERRRGGFDCALTDQTTSTAMIAVQGPKALRAVEPVVGADVGGLGYYTAVETTICGQPGVVSRTGYTGEDGCEIWVPAAAAEKVWTAILEHGAPLGARAAGLGARDTLRLEAAMPLYGHELAESIDPVQAGLDFALSLKGREFIGKQAIVARQADPSTPKRVGLSLEGKRAPRQGYRVLFGDQPIGEVTSGAYSPTLGRSIAMAYVAPQHAAAGTTLAVDIRGSIEPVTVVPLPFYKRPAT